MLPARRDAARSGGQPGGSYYDRPLMREIYRHNSRDNTLTCIDAFAPHGRYAAMPYWLI